MAKEKLDREKEGRKRQTGGNGKREREKAKCKRGECLSERERTKKIEGVKPVCNPESSWVCVDSI